MSLDFHNSTSFHSNIYNGPFSFPTSRNFTKPFNKTKSKLDDITVQFVLKNDVKKHLKSPIVTLKDITTTNKPNVTKQASSRRGTADPRKHKDKNKIHGSSGGHHEHHSFGHQKECLFQKMKIKGQMGGGGKKGYKKYIVPMMVGLLTAKAILIPLAFKSLTLLAVKGVFLGLVATIMASILGLRKMMETAPRIEGKKDEVTKIEVVPIPVHENYHHSSKYSTETFDPHLHRRRHQHNDDIAYKGYHPGVK